MPRNTSRCAVSQHTTCGTVLQAPELLVSLLKAAGENGPFIMVGHSMGGGLVQMLAAKNSGEWRSARILL
jgi:pimeloyl-ACP methyl ester carboxylesterase